VTRRTTPIYRFAESHEFTCDRPDRDPLQFSLVGNDAGTSTYVAAHKIVGRDVVVARATGYSADGVNGWKGTASRSCIGVNRAAWMSFSSGSEIRLSGLTGTVRQISSFPTPIHPAGRQDR
jgi:hypothetical protein